MNKYGNNGIVPNTNTDCKRNVVYNCNCGTCTREECVLRGKPERLPISRGGLGICPGHIAKATAVVPADIAYRAQKATSRAMPTGKAPAESEVLDNGQTAFERLLDAFEHDIATGKDCTESLLALATACAQSVVKKLADPQRKVATERETVSNSGHNPAMISLRNGIVSDLGRPGKPGKIATLLDAVNRATEIAYNKKGELTTIIADSDANRAVDILLDDTLSDGMDLVNDAVVALLTEVQQCIDLESVHTVNRLSRRVLIGLDDSAEWKEVETTGIQEVYRYIRREVSNSRAVQTDPRNGYSYIEELSVDPDDPEGNKLDYVYRRMSKYADLGGVSVDGLYTTDLASALNTEEIMEALNLTDRQARIIDLRLRGYGYQAIATYLGIREDNVRVTIKRIREKCEKIGFTPEMWADMTRREVIEL